MTGALVVADTIEGGRRLITVAAGLNLPVSAVTHDPTVATGLTDYVSDVVYHLVGSSDRLHDYYSAFAGLVRDRQPDLVLIADTVPGRELAAMSAAQLDVALVSGATRLVTDGTRITATRLVYGGSFEREEQLGGLTIVTVPTELHHPAAASATTAERVTVEATADQRVTVTKRATVTRSGPDLASALAIVGVGLGLRHRDDLSLADELAGALDGAVACTRPVAEDRGWLPTERYIGISGAKITSDLYVALGISGQTQHTAGLRDVKVVVAINSDPAAPIFAAADYGIVGDLYQIVPLLIQAIEDSRHGQ
ncbi:MAG: electron transfer flavoprotein subunit alpha/FixB family protein [Actinobacteria bacterium]|nr:electron transfer flavoprotein subunit alpha/FixB family protein [Actinomycetota bacterium]MCG2802418.1 electron transfer flavoprotein subunit alpha/FixB family protein [Cellulomonas sp.]